MNSTNGNRGQVIATGANQPKPRRASLPLIIVAALFIIVPFLTWYFTWFGRNLSDQEIAAYLADDKNPRHIQHALSQVEEKIERGDPNAKQFYPRIISLSKSPLGEVRKTAAWVMGQDNKSEEFHQALRGLLTDSEPLVRRNAALQLVRFADAAGRPEFRAMLQPFAARSPYAGTVISILPVGSKLSPGSLVARIRDSSGAVQEFRAPLDGTIGALAVKETDRVNQDQVVASLNPYQATIREALQALAYVGNTEDLEAVESIANADEENRKLAELTTKAIKSRALTQSQK